MTHFPWAQILDYAMRPAIWPSSATCCQAGDDQQSHNRPVAGHGCYQEFRNLFESSV